MYTILHFCIVLFIYIHVLFHLKKNDSNEVYEITHLQTKDNFEEVCDIRQPVIFCSNRHQPLLDVFKQENILKEAKSFNVNIRNTTKSSDTIETQTSLKNALALVKKDAPITSKYLCEKNREFLKESRLFHQIKLNDTFLKPSMSLNGSYDLQFASDKCQSPLRYELNYRTFFLVTEGIATIKLASPKNTRYLFEESDYTNFEFNSPVNPWLVQSEYKTEVDKVEWVDVKLAKGQLIFIPAFWWYSIEFDKGAIVAKFSYRTYMNALAISPRLINRFMHFIAEKSTF